MMCSTRKQIFIPVFISGKICAISSTRTKWNFHVIELPKLPEGIKEDSSALVLWGKFINAEQKEEFDMLAQKNPYIESAYKHLQVISQDKENYKFERSVN